MLWSRDFWKLSGKNDKELKTFPQGISTFTFNELVINMMSQGGEGYVQICVTVNAVALFISNFWN